MVIVSTLCEAREAETLSLAHSRVSKSTDLIHHQCEEESTQCKELHGLGLRANSVLLNEVEM